jgi:hypothetical protein
MTFMVARSDDVLVPLVAGGAQKRVTEENLDEYCDAVEAYRLHEFDLQVRGVVSHTLAHPHALRSTVAEYEPELAVMGILAAALSSVPNTPAHALHTQTHITMGIHAMALLTRVLAPPHLPCLWWPSCVQAAAMLRGLSQLIPPRALPLFSWAELETLVCGDKTVDVSLMKRHTT